MKAATLLLPLLYLTSLPVDASAVLEVELAGCAAHKNDSQRLSCFDRVYQQFSRQIATISEKPESPNHMGNWTISTSPSPLTANFNIELRLDAENSVKFRTQTVTPVLELICKDGKSSVAMHWGVYLGKNRTTMLTRVDNEEPQQRDWIIKNKYTVTNQVDGQQLISQLKNSASLIARITPYNAEPGSATFKLSGLHQQLDAFAISCSW